MSDPFLLPSTFSITGLLEYGDTNGVTRRAPAAEQINTAVRNLVLIIPGQSNGTSVLPTATVPANVAAIDNLNIRDGALYSITSKPLLGTNDYVQAAGGGGCIGTAVASLALTANKFDRVILAPIAIGATSMADWATGLCSTRLNVAMARLAARGIVPGMTNVTFALLMMIGETDNLLGTSQASFQASWATFRANAITAGFVGRMFLCNESYNNGVTSAAVRAAQAASWDSSVCFSGGDLDTIGSSGRIAPTGHPHFNDAGGATAASLIWDAMHASGGPY